MIISLVLALLVTGSGTITTYLYDESASFAARLCTGACVGLAALGLVGFVFASFLGLTPLAVALTALLLTIPFLVLKDPDRRSVVRRDLAVTQQAILRPRGKMLGYFLFYVVVSAVLWRAFDRAMIDLPDGIYTGLLNNFGDLPFHLSVITSFAYGNNFPPEDPTYAGVRFTYPFLSDFISAIFVRCGADLRQSMFLENIILGVSFVGLLHRWALELLKDRLAAVITPLLVLLNGGLGWVLLWNQAWQNNEGLWGVVKSLPPSLTVIPETTWRWGNAISALLVPQRGILIGLPLAVIVFTQWWLSIKEGETGKEGDGAAERRRSSPNSPKAKAGRKQDKNLPVSASPFLPFSLSRPMIAAGLIAGLLPLSHAHSFVVVMVVGACLALIQRKWTDWFTFFLVASLIALPQMWWSTHGSSVNAASFFSWEFGWDRGKSNAVWFWFKNTGLFIPLILIAILWRDKKYLVSRSLLKYYLPFTLCFIVPNLIKMAPWIWDNIKVLFYWWLASAPIVAVLLARLWHRGKLSRLAAVALFLSVTLSGSLDVVSIIFRSNKYQVFDQAGIQFAEVVKQETAPRSLIVHAPVHNHPVFLTGRRSLMGYPGHIWTHGLEFVQRESEIKRFFAGEPGAATLTSKYGITHAVVSPLERHNTPVNDQFFSRFLKIGETREYSLYQIAQP